MTEARMREGESLEAAVKRVFGAEARPGLHPNEYPIENRIGTLEDANGYSWGVFRVKPESCDYCGATGEMFTKHFLNEDARLCSHCYGHVEDEEAYYGGRDG